MNTDTISQRPSTQSDDNLLTPEEGGALTSWGEQLISGQKTYYNQPVIKKAHWKWEIVLYFFLGGLAGGSYLAASLADLLGSPRRDAPLVRAGRYLSFACIIVSPILLIKDLGRPERFLHMLRVLKFRSPMSLGTWGLSLFGMFCGLTATHQMAKDTGLSATFQGVASENHREYRQFLWPFCCLIHGSAAGVDRRSRVGARAAYPGAAVPNFRSFFRLCQPFAHPLAWTPQRGTAGAIRAR